MHFTTDPDLLDTPPEADFDRLTKLAAELIGTPMALLTIVDDRRQFFKSIHGLGEPWASLRETPIEMSICKHVVDRQHALVVDDATTHPLLGANDGIKALKVAAYMGEPVRAASGRVVGVFCVADSRPRRWTQNELDRLRTLARSVEHAIALRAAAIGQRTMVTELLRINEDLDKRSAELSVARQAAERALVQQTRFLAGLSHELRTPLNGVLGGLALLELTDSPEKQRAMTAMIRASSTALRDCVEELIAYCRIGAGIERIDSGPFAPAAAATEALDAVRALAAEKGLSLDLNAASDTPAVWVNDRRRVVAVLMNLLGNAIKYTKAGGVRLSLKPSGGALAFRVSDTGPGIDERHVELIFEPFNRGDATVANSAPGTGLGLAIAREMAQALGGSLDVERSVVGEGTTFLLLVPFHQDASVDEPDGDRLTA